MKRNKVAAESVTVTGKRKSREDWIAAARKVLDAHSFEHLSLKLATALTIVLLQPRIEGDFDGLVGVEAGIDLLRALQPA